MTDSTVRPKSAPRNDLTAEYVRTRVRYTAETGVFQWLPRVGVEDWIRRWNAKNAGRVAGSIDAHGYRIISIDGVQYKAHRLAWLYVTGEWPRGLIDHANRDASDNRFQNLREATHEDNTHNRDICRKNTSGHSGVCWNHVQKKWHARGSVGGRRFFLGYYRDIDDAAEACRQFRATHHGKFAGVTSRDA